MERPLNMEDGWEAIVNNGERQKRIDAFHARRYQNKLDKLRIRAMICGIAMVVIAALGLTGALISWVAAPVALVLAGVCCFTMGRVFEFLRK